MSSLVARRRALVGGSNSASFNWYVNSVTGSDSNSGKTKGSAFASFTPLASVLRAGQSIGVARGSVNRTAVAPTVGGLTIAPYGAGAKPLFLGSTQVSSGSWTTVSGNDVKVATALAFSGTHIFWDNGTGASGTDGVGVTALAKGVSGTSSTVTITIASPGVVTWNSHGLPNGNAVILTTTGALPTGLTAGTRYYVVSAAANTFQVAATPGGTAINTTGSQSGTHTANAWLGTNQYVIAGGDLHVNIGRAPTSSDKFEVPQRVPLALDGISNIVVKGIDVRYSSGNGISLSPTTATDNTSFRDCDLSWCISDLMNGFTKSTGALVENCSFHDAPSTSVDAISYHNDGSGIIRGNTFTRIAKNGVVNSEKGTWTIYNNVFNGANINIYTDGGIGSCQIYRNRLYNVKPQQAAGEPFIYIGGGGGALTTGTVVNLYNNSVAMGVLPGDGGSTNVRGIRFDGGGTVRVQNNTVWGTSDVGGTQMSIGLYKSAGSFTVDSNNAVGGSSTNNSGWAAETALAADPHTDVTTGDLSPAVGSPLVGAGVAIPGTTTGSPPDIGYTGAA